MFDAASAHRALHLTGLVYYDDDAGGLRRGSSSAQDCTQADPATRLQVTYRSGENLQRVGQLQIRSLRTTRGQSHHEIRQL